MSIDAKGRPRVAITGIGVKTPAGLDPDTFWSTLKAAEKTMAEPMRYIESDDLSVRFACHVVGFDPADYLGPKESRRQDRVAQLGYAAAADALTDAGEIAGDPARCGVVVGTGVGGLSTLEEQIVLRHEKGPSRVSPLLVPMMMTNATAGLISIQLGWTGPSLCITTACAASANAIGEGIRLIREGSADVVMAGGTESAITRTAIAGFARAGALSGRNDDPERASRPFDAGRDGFVMGEGAAFLVLERWDRAEARGARIYGEMLGYGRTCDAYHITAPSPGGEGAFACMSLAIEDASLTPSDIGHVNSHGTSTPLGDVGESEAIVKLMGDKVPVTSTKGVTGHLVGAAGAAEAVATLMACRDGVVPPVANYTDPDPEIRADVVHGELRSVPSKIGLSNSFGFGGHNATLILQAIA